MKSQYTAQPLFFISAAILAILSPWLLLWGWFVSPNGYTMAIHANGMLFGFTGALIAGYLVGKQAPITLFSLYAFWLLARIWEIFFALVPGVDWLYVGYGIFLAMLVVPKFKAAKKWRNRVMIPLLGLIALFPAIWKMAQLVSIDIPFPRTSFVLLIAMLVFFMGGRLITPLMTRAYAESGQRLPHRVQPYLEGTILVFFALAIILSFLSIAAHWFPLFSLVAALLIFIRLCRWRLHRLGRQYADLWGFVAGYVWLAMGLFLFSYALLSQQATQASLHLMAIGAIGTISSTVMLRISHPRAKQAVNALFYWVIVLHAGAAIARYTVIWVVYGEIALVLSAGLWSLGYMLVLWGFLKQRWRQDKTAPA